MTAYESQKLTRRLVTSLWVCWAIAFGAIALELLLPRLMSKLWLPLPILAIAYGELAYMRKYQENEEIGCPGILKVSVLTLFWSALVMIVIQILNSRYLLDNLIDWSNTNREIPFVTCLIVFPVCMLMCLWVMSHGYMQSRSTAYRAKGKLRVGNGVVASLFARENRYQVQLLFMLSLALSCVEWWYYFVYYFNVNMNTPDVFFFNWMPISLFVFSLFFMGSRYQNIASVIGPIVETQRERGFLVRFLVFAEDRMLLSLNEFDRWDTPAVTHMGVLDVENEAKVRAAFENIWGNDNFGIRYLYQTGINNLTPNVKHYAVFVEGEHFIKDQTLESWFSLDQINRFINTARLSAELSDELFRIFTITMAWKTYDREGHRLYPIKHYRPTFRLRDLRTWDVDYGDLSWMSVAENNQDRPFFQTRRLWRKITGSRF